MSNTVDELSQLQAAIAAQEALRGLVDDEIIEATIAALNQRIADLKVGGQSQRRRMVTVLFMDTVGSTTIVRDRDPEESLGIMDTALSRLARPIEEHGGRVTRFMGDGFKAVFGLPSTHENDADMAVRAGLALLEVAQAYALELEQTHGIPGYQIRLGIHTGWVAVGGQSEAEGTVMGATVNLAARMESAAQPGTLLITHDTYQHIRGAFDIEPQGSIIVKGFSKPISVYRVLAAKARSFRTHRRGIEGIQTHMVGRVHELGMLQDAYLDAFEAAETRVITVVGEAGLGKSRLVYEFEEWLELRPEIVRYFKGRAMPYLQNVPNALFRDLFAFRFEIRETDSAATALEKFRTGTAGILDPKYADVMGHWLGFDFSASSAVNQLLGSAEFSEFAQHQLVRYFRDVAMAEPVVVLLEDIHWADESSLDLIGHLAATIPVAHLLIAPMARLAFFDRRPHWGEGQNAFTRVELKPLSRRTSRMLVDEILQRVEQLPDALCDNIVDAAEGNPLYVEEQIKMFIDQGIIEIRGDHWRVLPDRVESFRVPPTLTGLLQARLDGLPQQEREVLQHASVIGRVFWEETVADLLSVAHEEVRPILEAVRERELVFQRERSTFAGTTEYIFKHSLLRDVAYETVLLKQRAELHGHAARWLEATAGERLGESLGLIAEHYEAAGELILAASYFGRAAESAHDRFALGEALTVAQRAVDLLLDVEESQVVPLRIRHLLILSNIIRVKGNILEARGLLEGWLPQARQYADPSITVPWLRSLGEAAISLGDFYKGREFLEESLALARQTGDRQMLFEVLLSLSHLGWRTGKLLESVPHVQECLALAEALGDRRAVGEATMLLAFHAEMLGEDWAEGLELHRQVEAIGRETGDASLIARSLNNEGYTLYHMGEYQAALDAFEEAMAIEREAGWDQGVSYTACRMAMALIRLGQKQEAEAYLKEGLQLALATNRVQTVLYGLLAHALLRLKSGRVTAAIELVGLAQAHRGYVELDHGLIKEEILREARERFSGEEVQSALRKGAELDFETVLTQLLTEL